MLRLGQLAEPSFKAVGSDVVGLDSTIVGCGAVLQPPGILSRMPPLGMQLESQHARERAVPSTQRRPEIGAGPDASQGARLAASSSITPGGERGEESGEEGARTGWGGVGQASPPCYPLSCSPRSTLCDGPRGSGRGPGLGLHT